MHTVLKQCNAFKFGEFSTRKRNHSECECNVAVNDVWLINRLRRLWLQEPRIRKQGRTSKFDSAKLYTKYMMGPDNFL